MRRKKFHCFSFTSLSFVAEATFGVTLGVKKNKNLSKVEMRNVMSRSLQGKIFNDTIKHSCQLQISSRT